MGKRNRSKAKHEARKAGYVDHLRKRVRKRVREGEDIVAKEFDDVYAKRPRSQADVLRIAMSRWQCDAALLPVDTYAHRVIIRNPHDVREILVARLPDMITAKDAAKIERAYTELTQPLDFIQDRHKGIPLHRPGRPDRNRASDSGAWHFGSWETTSKKPHVTSESRAPLQESPYAVRKIDNMLWHIKQFVVPHFERTIKRYFPDQARWMEICHRRTDHYLRQIFQDRPALYLGRGFHAVAIKDGSSDLLHIDMHDGCIMAWVYVVGAWEEEGYLVLPQLGLKFRVPSRTAFGFLAARLAHFTTTPIGGTRVVLTCFTDRFLFQHAVKQFGEPVYL